MINKINIINHKHWIPNSASTSGAFQSLSLSRCRSHRYLQYNDLSLISASSVSGRLFQTFKKTYIYIERSSSIKANKYFCITYYSSLKLINPSSPKQRQHYYSWRKEKLNFCWDSIWVSVKVVGNSKIETKNILKQNDFF